MSISSHQQPFSETTIRQFLLARLAAHEQSAFEVALISNSQLEQRIRLAEFELMDDYARDRLSPKEREAFEHKFLLTASRKIKLEVSNALRECLARETVLEAAPPRSREEFFGWRCLWRVAFAALLLVLLLAGVWLITKEPQIARRMIPKRLRPAAAITPTPQAAHHAVNSLDSPVHKEHSPTEPGHEATPSAIVLAPDASVESAPVVTITHGSPVLRLELMLENSQAATYRAEVMNQSGEVVYSVSEIAAEGGTDRVTVEVPVDRLRPGDSQIRLTRTGGGASSVATYYFRVQ